jgi:hypothetical protein
MLARHGQSPQEWLEESLRAAEQLPETYERLQATAASYAGTDPEQVVDEDFEYGLELVLDGVQARLDAST